MNEALPLVTVAVPCYNHERYVAECIESIISQTYKNIELIVVDDGSTDRSPEILKNLQKKYGFKLILQSNQGVVKTINNILQHSTHGTYFSLCASDDYWLPTKIEKQIAFMESSRFYPMCYGKSHFVDSQSEIMRDCDVVNKALKGGWLFEEIFLFKIHPPVNYMYRTCIFTEIGYYSEDIIADDYYMNLKISSKYAIGFLDEYLGYYRVSDDSIRLDRLNKVYDSHMMALENYKNHPLYGKAKAIAYLRKYDLFAGFRKHKKRAIANLVRALPLFYKKRFLIACVKLVIFWKPDEMRSG